MKISSHGRHEGDHRFKYDSKIEVLLYDAAVLLRSYKCEVDQICAEFTAISIDFQPFYILEAARREAQSYICQTYQPLRLTQNNEDCLLAR